MATPGKSGVVAEVFGLIMFIVSGLAFETILFNKFGWEIAALPFCLAFAAIGFRLGWPPADGNAGTRGNAAGAGYVVALDPEDPDAGVPRRRA